MGLFNRRKVNIQNIQLTINNQVMGMSPDKIYATQPPLQAVVSFVAQNIAQLPIKSYKRVDDTDRQRDTDSVVAKLFANPGSGKTSYELMYETVADYKLYGQSIWLVLPSTDTASGYQIRRIPQNWIVETLTADGFTPSGYRILNPDGKGVPVDIKAKDCIVFKSYNPADPVMPLSPVTALKEVLCEQMNSWAYRNAVWKNGGWVSRYIERPGDTPWSNEARMRFATSWKEKFAGKDGVNSGGTPILEDGMKMHTISMDSGAAQWSEAAKLAREDVAAAYHINPSLVWNMGTSTYASAKDNARALYADTLGTDIKFFADKINLCLLPMIGADEDIYVELDIQAKLAGSFEEQSQSLQRAVGGPWMLIDEARAIMNLPKIEDGDKLITPLNVIKGGLANPQDTAPKSASNIKTKSDDDEDDEYDLELTTEPSQELSDELSSALRTFFKRQRKKVIPAISSYLDTQKAKSDIWWDKDRWDRELSEDLYPIMLAAVVEQGRKTCVGMGLDPNLFSEDLVKAYMQKMALGSATAINKITYKQLVKAIAGDIGEEAQGATTDGVFDMAEDTRATQSGRAFIASASNWAAIEAVRQMINGEQYDEEEQGTLYKVWICQFRNSRYSHQLMHGEMAEWDEPFSNGAYYPCDSSLPTYERANCLCKLKLVRY